MTTKKERNTTSEQSQSDKFKEAARDMDCDTDEDTWNRRLKKVVKHKPVDKPE